MYKLKSKMQYYFTIYRGRFMALVIGVPITLVAIVLLVSSLTYAWNEENFAWNEENILVDERFELVSLVFRLAGDPNFSHLNTEYQRSLNETFDEFADHPAVEYTRWLGSVLSFCAVLLMAVHLERQDDGFRLSDNIGALVACRRWTPITAVRFVELLNDFYVDTDFAEFFYHNMRYFYTRSEYTFRRFAYMDREWFRQFGLNPDNLRVIIAPSQSRNNYAARVWGLSADDTIVYSAINSYNYHILIHEFVHGFANHLGDVLYHTNEEFRMWSDASVDLHRFPAYPSGLNMGYEYLTRAFTWLYFSETQNRCVESEIDAAVRNGWPYLMNVFNLIQEIEPEYIADIVKNAPEVVTVHCAVPGYISAAAKAALTDIIGANFSFGGEFLRVNTFIEPYWVIRFHPIDTAGELFSTEELIMHNINNFPTQKGELVLLIDYDGILVEYMNLPTAYRYFLHIDIGPGGEHDQDFRDPIFRAFHVIPLK